MTEQNPLNTPPEASAAETVPLTGAPFAATAPPAPSPAYSVPPTVSPIPSGTAPVRWGGVVWGLLLTLFAGATLYVLASAERVREVGDWLASLTPGSAWALGAAAIGLVIVVSALLGGIRASQRRRVRARI